MTTELKMLVLAVLIPLLMVTVQGTILTFKVGVSPLIGNREQFPALQGWAGRLLRAHANQLENLVLFGLIVGVAHAAQVSNNVTRIAAEAFVAARLVHAISYVAGILYIRTVAFYAGVACIWAIAIQLL